MKRISLLLAVLAAFLTLNAVPAKAGGCVLRQPGATDVMNCGPAQFDSITTSGTLTTTGTLSAEQITSTDDATITDDLNVGGAAIVTGNITTTTGTVSAEQLTSTDDATITGDLTAATVAASIADLSVEVERVENVDIANAATDSFDFDFEPSYIVINYHGYCVHDTSSEAGITMGSALVTITGTDTATVASSSVHFNNNNTASRWQSTGADTTNVSVTLCGSDASDQGSITSALTSWTTSTHVLLITHTVANTTDATTRITWTATAYR